MSASYKKRHARINDVSRLMDIAHKRYRAGDADGAERQYCRVTEVAPDNSEAWHMAGLLALDAGHRDEAIIRFQRALELRPDFPEALNNLGNIMLNMEELEAAERLLLLALKSRPDFPDAMSNLGGLLIMQKRYDEAEALLRSVATLYPKFAAAQNNLGKVLAETGQQDESEVVYRRALQLEPVNTVYMAAIGRLQMQRGRHGEARDMFQQALACDPYCIPALSGLANSKKFEPGDPEIEQFKKVALKVGQMDLDTQRGFMFAWAKVFDDIGQYDRAFRCYKGGNDIRRVQRPYSSSTDNMINHEIMRVFTPDLIKQFEGEGYDSEKPVFIVGMPRSGTTLTEQIISSHPQVYGAGELSYVADQLRELSGGNSKIGYHTAMANITAEKLHVMGRSYVERVQLLDPQALRITDKMPANFRHVGLIRMMLPQAKVIHVRRNPVDTCLSCFQQNFDSGQEFSDDLHDLGRYYGNYMRVMEHWRQLLPGYMLEIDYEQLVVEPEKSAQRLIDFIGLEWNDACLRPDRNDRRVRTASQWQVRQKIHTGSVERWRRYEENLQPLLATLRENGVDV
jgi:Flp pilus assembly protein TadD